MPNPTQRSARDIMGELNAADREVLERHLRSKRGRRRLTDEDLSAKHGHYVPGSLDFDEQARKQFGSIRCQFEGCRNVKEHVFTSDMHQVKTCDAHRAAKPLIDAKQKASNGGSTQTQGKGVSARR